MISGSKSGSSSRLDAKRGCLIGIRLPMCGLQRRSAVDVELRLDMR